MTIATGDRWHALASILAARAGKDVYSEKPGGLPIADCQALADTMNHFGRVFQAGTQRRSVANFQLAVRLAHSGKLSKLHTLHASVYTPGNDYNWLPAETGALPGGRRPLASPDVSESVARERAALVETRPCQADNAVARLSKSRWAGSSVDRDREVT